jgi:hypothetical protein
LPESVADDVGSDPSPSRDVFEGLVDHADHRNALHGHADHRGHVLNLIEVKKIYKIPFKPFST